MTHENKALILIALLGFGSLSLLWVLSARSGITRRVSREMQWSDNQESLSPYSPERRLAPLPTGAVRLSFVAAPNSYIVADYPGLLPFLRRLGKKEISVEFEVACGFRGGTPKWLNLRSIAGLSVENVASKTGWTESLGNDVNPLSGACDWW